MKTKRETLGNLLYRTRRAHNYTLKYVYTQTGIAPGRLHHIENDVNLPSLPNIVKLCDYYGIPFAKVAAIIRGYE